MRKPAGKKPSARTFQLWGWAFFVLSAIFFIFAAVQSGDWVALVGSVCFFVANIAFLIPVLQKME